MLQEVGVTHCIIGHSERRTMFGDTDETVNKKAKRLIEAGITPILCIGETEAQYDAGESEKVIRDQLTGSLADMCAKCVADIVIAYEPIWAIGTGKSASVEIAENCCRIVRDQVKVMYGEEAAEKVRVQYGGSVKPNNIAEYMAQPDIDGALIGGVWGALIGFLFLNPLLGIVAGAGLGAATGEVGDFGISHRFMNELATHLKPGSSALFIPLKKEAVDETLRALGNSDGVVLSTDLKLEDEYQMEKLFEEMTAERAKKTS
jgi:uncharacterized membrane protein